MLSKYPCKLVTETGVLRDMKGQDTGAKIELKMFLTENVRATVEGTEVDAPGKVDVYYKMFTAAFPLVVSKFFVGKSTLQPTSSGRTRHACRRGTSL